LEYIGIVIKKSIEVFAIKLKRLVLAIGREPAKKLIARYLTKFNLDAALVAFFGVDPKTEIFFCENGI
jgi:hypothetical protein